MHDFIYRIDDILISGAAAEISGHFFTDLISGEFFALLQKDSRRSADEKPSKLSRNLADGSHFGCCPQVSGTALLQVSVPSEVLLSPRNGTVPVQLHQM